MGANTAMFGLVNTLLLQPLKIGNPGEIASCYSVDIHMPQTARPFSYPNYADLREHNSVFTSLAAHSQTLKKSPMLECKLRWSPIRIGKNTALTPSCWVRHCVSTEGYSRWSESLHGNSPCRW